jgi:hypothetical protein
MEWIGRASLVPWWGGGGGGAAGCLACRGFDGSAFGSLLTARLEAGGEGVRRRDQGRSVGAWASGQVGGEGKREERGRPAGGGVGVRERHRQRQDGPLHSLLGLGSQAKHMRDFFYFFDFVKLYLRGVALFDEGERRARTFPLGAHARTGTICSALPALLDVIELWCPVLLSVFGALLKLVNSNI